MGSAEYSQMTPTHDDDWTSRLPKSKHVQFFRDADWAASYLGPLDRWDPSLKFAANMVFADSRGACIYWGPERVAFYNEAFMPMAGSAHPLLMGNPFAVGFPELCTAIKPLFDKAEADGMTVDVHNIPLFVQRYGYLEETYFIGQFIPLRGDSGRVEGFYNTVYESTFRALYDRRRATIDLITALPISSVSSVFQNLVGALEKNPNDISMMLVYSADQTVSEACQMTLKGSIGVPAGHPIAPAQAELHHCRQGLFPLLDKARNQTSPMIVPTTDQSLQQHGVSLLKGIQWVGFGEQPQEIVIAPLTNGSRLFGFLVLGTNPRRKFDSDCQQFINDLVQQLLSKLHSATSAEEAQRREESLLRDLAASERRIRYMAMYAPVGMGYLDRDGRIVWANQQWYDILGTSKEATADPEAVFDLYHENYQSEVRGLFAQLLEGTPYVTGELRLKRQFTPPNGSPEHACVLVHGFSMKEGEEAKYIMGCITDISRLKWAETVQSRSAAAAQEAKRRQEEFIDLTSHELRNPLGAIMQCAENIARSFKRSDTVNAPNLLEILHDNVHTAETILACASHQKRIIDDVLLLSRLESHMLSITPVQTNVDIIISNAERMFSGECKQHDIALTIHRHQSFVSNKAESVMCDPSRLMQIIINVIANGIKFVRPEAKREISVTYGAASSVQEVHALNPNVRWCPSVKQKQQDPIFSPDWGQGEPLFVFFAIRDSGPGLAPQDVDHLFQRFAQTTKLTHIHYGGSGLGLYISRELAEKQGGEIGIASQKGAGATFTFYIKTMRAVDQPAEPAPRSSLQQHFRSLSFEASQQSPNTSSNNSKLHVLLAEDNLVNQKFLARGLERNGWTVHVANHGLEAIDILKRSASWKQPELNGSTSDSLPNIPSAPPFEVDLILMDWEMPILDGLTASRRIRELEAQLSKHRIPIIGITANARQEQIQMALDAGMDDVLPKPFLVSDMIAKMEEWRGRVVRDG